jgi:hypothetical protein
MADLAAPGGLLYLVEFHPLHSILGDEDLTVTYPYFHDEPQRFDDGDGTYADLAATTETSETVEWTHGLGEVLTAVLDAGLTIESFREYDHTLFPRWPFLVRGDDGAYRLPPDVPAIPLMYSLRARKPA